MLVGAAAGLAHEADGVTVVDHHEGVVALGEIADFAQWCDETVHRKHAIGDDEFEARLGGVGGLELRFKVGEIAVFVAVALRFAEADAVDDRGVVEFVTDHGVLGGEERFEGAAVGIEAGRVEDRVLGAEKRAEAFFQLGVDFLRAADEAHGGEAVAPAVERGVGGGDDFGIIGEAEIVVGAEIQNLASTRDGDVSGLRRRDQALALGEAGGIDFAERFLEMREVGGRHGLFPVEDDFAAAAGAHEIEAFLEIRVVETVRDDG